VTAGSMVSMNQNGYKLIGFLVWRGGKWYLRRKLPSTRTLAVTGFAGVSALALAALLARRLGS
jgi:hypothetical protein